MMQGPHREFNEVLPSVLPLVQAVHPINHGKSEHGTVWVFRMMILPQTIMV